MLKTKTDIEYSKFSHTFSLTHEIYGLSQIFRTIWRKQNGDCTSNWTWPFSLYLFFTQKQWETNVIFHPQLNIMLLDYQKNKSWKYFQKVQRDCLSKRKLPVTLSWLVAYDGTVTWSSGTPAALVRMRRAKAPQMLSNTPELLSALTALASRLRISE